MLLDVLTRISADTGLDPEQQRQTLINLLNSSARAMYNRLECNKVYWENTLSVPPNKIVTLPPYIYELRGMRASTTEMVFTAKSMSSPRYVRKDWSYRWRNWRDLGESPIMMNPSLVAPLSVSVANIETSPVTLYISGQTNKALRIEEKVVVDSLSKQTLNMFGPEIYAIYCTDSNRTCDISISDANGNLLAVLYNMDNETRYKMVDVSEAPWSLDTTGGNSLIDVLYKCLLRRMSRDSDSFPASADYDNAWYWMAMYLYYKPMQNKPTDFENFFSNALIEMKAIKEGNEGNLDKRVSFGRNKYYNLTKGIKVYPGAITNIDRVN
jgi:hypothetical protein